MKNISVRFGLQTIGRQFPDEATIGQIVGDNTVKSFLGYGDNVRAIVNGVTMPSDSVVSDGTVISVETAANSKAAPDKVCIKFGLAFVERSYPAAVTVADIKADTTARAALGYGDNVRVVLNGVVLPDSAMIEPGSTVSIETAANAKAN